MEQQPHPLRPRWLAGAERRCIDGADTERHQGRRRLVQEQPFAVPHLHHAQLVGDGDRPQTGRHRLFSNTLYLGVPIPHANNQTITFIENDAILGDIDENFGGNFINEETILAAARAKGYGTAAVGKLGPTLLFDHTDRSGSPTVIVDDATGSSTGIPLSAEMQALLTAAGLPLVAPSRGANGSSGNSTTPAPPSPM